MLAGEITAGVALMPTIYREKGFRFFFFSLDGCEPPHVYVEEGDAYAKFWLNPVELAQNYGFRSHELNKLRQMTMAQRMSFKEAWNEYFGIED